MSAAAQTRCISVAVHPGGAAGAQHRRGKVLDLERKPPADWLFRRAGPVLQRNKAA
jgi:hypothetical protein